MKIESRRKILSPIVYTIILLIIMFGVLEAGLRMLSIHLYLTDDGYAWGKKYNHIYGWDLTPNYRGTYFDWVTNKPRETDPKYRRTISINSSAFRDDEEITLTKPANTFRLFTLGDSITFGWGVESVDTFTKKLQQRLNEFSSNTKFQAINAGIVGFNSYQGVRLLKHKLLAYNPDLIIVAYGGTNYVLSASTDKESLRTGSLTLTKIANIGRKFYIYRSLREIMIRFNKVSKDKMKRRVYPEDFRNDLRNLIKIAKENNIGVVLMTIPSNVLTGQVAKWTIEKRSYSNSKEEVISEHKKMNDIIREVAKDEKIVLADIAEKFNELKNAGREDLFYRPEDAWDDYHPSEEGHRIIAEELYRIITAKFLVPVLNKTTYISE